jgi:hypothetical protein
LAAFFNCCRRIPIKEFNVNLHTDDLHIHAITTLSTPAEVIRDQNSVQGAFFVLALISWSTEVHSEDSCRRVPVPGLFVTN